ncbi:hypothetical protein P5609_001680 [Bacillus licheniformis]
MASRTGGAMVREATVQTFGFDINEVCVKAQCGLEFHIPEVDNNPDRLSGWLLIPPKDGVLKEIKPAPAADWIAKQNIRSSRRQVPRLVFQCRRNCKLFNYRTHRSRIERPYQPACNVVP